jgi:hypothetical protein
MLEIVRWGLHEPVKFIRLQQRLIVYIVFEMRLGPAQPSSWRVPGSALVHLDLRAAGLSLERIRISSPVKGVLVKLRYHTLGALLKRARRSWRSSLSGNVS